ncbi:thioesterase family protein [Pseudomonas sp. BN102]|uniref:acyl-CoA thioesterase n=1 Tax=Pseudomonas sp. BN102 TaxID=2567886 RepID=UPI00245868DA|nr:thioesterase family protein [Pseudomonas sp. BN102]MDH4612441.1 acyl-CoA thioesterase [Pseudomonas sp. BN102]
MNWDRPNPFLIEVVVGNADIDGLGHVNHSIYVKWLEQCSWTQSLSLGMSLSDYQRMDRGMAVVRNELDYLASAYEGDRLLVGTWIVALEKRVKLVRHFQIIRPADQQLLLRAQTSFVCVEISSGRPRRMPEEFLEAYERACVRNT